MGRASGGNFFPGGSRVPQPFLPSWQPIGSPFGQSGDGSHIHSLLSLNWAGSGCRALLEPQALIMCFKKTHPCHWNPCVWRPVCRSGGQAHGWLGWLPYAPNGRTATESCTWLDAESHQSFTSFTKLIENSHVKRKFPSK